MSALAIALAALWLIASEVHVQGQNAPSVFASPRDYATADIRVITPGVVFASGLPDIAAAFAKETGKKSELTLIAPRLIAHVGPRLGSAGFL